MGHLQVTVVNSESEQSGMRAGRSSARSRATCATSGLGRRVVGWLAKRGDLIRLGRGGDVGRTSEVVLGDSLFFMPRRSSFPSIALRERPIAREILPALSPDNQRFFTSSSSSSPHLI